MNITKLLFITLLIVTFSARSQTFQDNFQRIGEVPFAIDGEWEPVSFQFVDENVGVILARKKFVQNIDSTILLYRTTNGGLNWTKHYRPAVNCNSDLRKTNSGMLYFTYYDTTISNCGFGGFCYKTCYSVDNGANWQTRRVDEIDGISSGFSQAFYCDNQYAIMLYDGFASGCGVQDGIYLTQNNFQSSVFVGAYHPRQVAVTENGYEFWEDGQLVQISKTGLVTTQPIGINCPKNETVHVYPTENHCYFTYQVDCPQDENLDPNKSWQGVRTEYSDGTASSLKFIECEFPYNRPDRVLFNTTLMSLGYKNAYYSSFSEIDMAQDSVFVYNPIERFGFGDTNYIEDCSQMFYLSKDTIFVLGHLKNDTQWVLYRTTNGQPKAHDACPMTNGTVAFMEEKEFEQALSIYPNPFTGNIHLDFAGVNEEIEVLVYSENGKVLHHESGLTKELTSLDLSHLDVGIYFVQLIGRNFSKTKKLIKI